MARRALSVFLVLVILSTCSGCTLVGLGIGAAIPKKTTYEVSEGEPIGETLRAAAVREDLEVGDDMDVTVQPAPAAPEIGPPIAVRIPRVVSGRFHSLDPSRLRLDGEDYFAEVPLERIEKVRVAHGSHWLGGMFFGLACDGVVASVALSIILSLKGIR